MRTRGTRVAVTAIDIQVEDVAASTRLLSEAYGWRVLTDDPDLGELDAAECGSCCRATRWFRGGVPTESSFTTQSRMLLWQQTLQ